MEIPKWRPDLTYSLVRGTAAQRRAALAAKADVYILARDTIKDVVNSRWNTVVVDEASGFKNHQSVRFRVGRTLRRKARHFWELTGTPSPGGLHDLWSQVYLLDQGKRLGKNISAYRQRWFTPGWQLPSNGVITGWDPRPGADEEIYAAVEDICLSMDSTGRVDVPAELYNALPVTLSPPVMQAYREMREDLVTGLKLLGGVHHSAANAAVATGRLSQIATGFLYADDQSVLRTGDFTWLHDDTVNAVREVVEETGSPVQVMYRFKPERDRLLKLLPGAHSIDEPHAVKRWNAGEIPVLLAHPASAGHGLNLQFGGHTQVWSSLTWSLEEWDQGIKRLVRPGQQQHVTIHTVEPRVPVVAAQLARLREKDGVQQALRDALEAPL